MEKHRTHILIVDDDPAILATARLFLKQKFDHVHGLKGPESLDKVMRETPFDIVLLDMNYSRGESDGKEGLSLIEHIIREYPGTEVIPITAYGEIDLAVEALKRGARDFVTKPWQNEKLYTTIVNLLSIRNANQEIRVLKDVNEQLNRINSERMIGNSAPFNRMMETISKVAPTDANVLILGENGTGKEMVAHELHQKSGRSDKAFVKVDLGSLSESLFESELFGHVKGAFTDAKTERAGKLEIADGGTIFLDEIGNINPAQQSKLLTVIEQKRITRLGSNQSISLDVRFISATNADINELVRDGLFRQDLLYRINTIEILVPPLKERIDDIPLLVGHYMSVYKNKYRKSSLKMSNEALDALKEYTWPGNIRELAHIVERTVILASQTVITPAQLQVVNNVSESGETNLNIEEMEKSLILKSLKKNKGNISHSARDLGIDRQALYRRLEKYGL